MVKTSKKEMVEIFILIVISFSPLLSNIQKLILVLALTVLNLKNLIYIHKRKGLILYSLISIFIMSLALDFRNIKNIDQMSVLNLYFPLCFFLGFLISQKYSIEKYLYYLEKIIFITAIFSLIGVFIYTFFPSLVYKLPTYNYYHTNHKTAYIFNILLSKNGVLHRNAGIAWEPGAFQFLLNLGLYSYIKINDRINFLKIFIYSLGIILTKSTAGLIIFIFTTFNILKKDKRIKWLILVSILMFSNSIIQELLYQYNYKLFGSYAFVSRLQPMLNAFKVGKNFFWGLGNSGYDLYYKSLGVGAWDSFGQIFIRYGYILFILIIFFLLKIFRKNINLFLILVITFLSQTIWFFPLITPFYFMDSKDNNKIKDKKRGLDEDIMVDKSTTTRS